MNNFSRTIGLLTLATAIPLVTSAGAGASALAPSTENLDSLGTSSGNGELTPNMIAEVHQSERSDTGGLVSVTWSIENSGDDRESLTWLKDRSYTYSGQNFAGITAINSEEATRYHPIMDGKGECLCSGNTSNEVKLSLDPGDKIAYWSLFSISDEVDSITLEVPQFDPIEDIPIS